jgi:hypothetical protein
LPERSVLGLLGGVVFEQAEPEPSLKDVLDLATVGVDGWRSLCIESICQPALFFAGGSFLVLVDGSQQSKREALPPTSGTSAPGVAEGIADIRGRRTKSPTLLLAVRGVTSSSVVGCDHDKTRFIHGRVVAKHVVAVLERENAAEHRTRGL